MRAVFLAALVTMASTGALVVAQQTSAVPQPRADALPAPGPASPKQSRTIPKPEGLMPIVPAGFAVTTYAELQAPRMMVYAPNGDLFVSSPAANTIVVLGSEREGSRLARKLCVVKHRGSAMSEDIVEYRVGPRGLELG